MTAPIVSKYNQLKLCDMVEVRFTFRSEVYIKAETIEEAREKFEGMGLLSAEVLEHHGGVVEVYEEEVQ